MHEQEKRPGSVLTNRSISVSALYEEIDYFEICWFETRLRQRPNFQTL